MLFSSTFAPVSSLKTRNESFCASLERKSVEAMASLSFCPSRKGEKGREARGKATRRHGSRKARRRHCRQAEFQASCTLFRVLDSLGMQRPCFRGAPSERAA